MKKYFISSTFLLFLFTIFAGAHALAGGCCFKSFSATNGIANSKQPAHINVSFIDPENPYTDEGNTTLSSLKDQKIEIHIDSPIAGQSCRMISEKTDENGAVEADCSSPVVGAMYVHFSAPNIKAEVSQVIAQASKPVYFDVNPDAQPTTAVEPTVESQNPSVEPTTSIEPTKVEDSQEAIEMKNKIAQLEKKVNKQEKEVNSLKSILNKIMGYFSRLFK